MTPRILPLGSTIHLLQPMQLEGLGSSAQWTANGLDTTTHRCVKHIVETDTGCWVFIPAGAYKGWRKFPNEVIRYIRATPPDDVLELVKAHDEAKKAAAEQAAKSAATGADTQAQTDLDATA